MWWARVSLVPCKQHWVAMGTAALSIMGYKVYLMSMVTVSLWQMVDQVSPFYSFPVMFYSLPSLPFLCFCSLIYISFFICLTADLSFSIFLFMWIKLNSSCSHPPYLKYQYVYIHSLFCKFFSHPPSFPASGKASAAGGAGQSQERLGGWEAQTTAAQGLTHIHKMI